MKNRPHPGYPTFYILRRIQHHSLNQFKFLKMKINRIWAIIKYIESFLLLSVCTESVFEVWRYIIWKCNIIVFINSLKRCEYWNVGVSNVASWSIKYSHTNLNNSNRISGVRSSINVSFLYFKNLNPVFLNRTVWTKITKFFLLMGSLQCYQTLH